MNLKIKRPESVSIQINRTISLLERSQARSLRVLSAPVQNPTFRDVSHRADKTLLADATNDFCLLGPRDLENVRSIAKRMANPLFQRKLVILLGEAAAFIPNRLNT
jgi:hypothetical protein